jgi:hypothetical protein
LHLLACLFFHSFLSFYKPILMFSPRLIFYLVPIACFFAPCLSLYIGKILQKGKTGGFFFWP